MKQSERPVVHKVRIRTVLTGSLIAGQGWSSGMLTTAIFGNIFAVDIVATVVNVNEEAQTFVMDDGTGTVPVKVFRGVLPEVGSLIRVIGKPRDHEGERIVVADIVKHNIDPTHVPLREVEIQYLERTFAPEHTTPHTKVEEMPTHNTSLKETSEQFSEQPSSPEHPKSRLIELIKVLDTGSGADYEDVLTQANMGNAEHVLDGMLKRGDVFEIKPGRLKIMD